MVRVRRYTTPNDCPWEKKEKCLKKTRKILMERNHQQPTSRATVIHLDRNILESSINDKAAPCVAPQSFSTLEDKMERYQLELNVNVYFVQKRKKKTFSGMRSSGKDVSGGLEASPLRAYSSTGSKDPIETKEYSYLVRNKEIGLRENARKGFLALCCTCVDECGEDCACVAASITHGSSFVAQGQFVYIAGPRDFYTCAAFVCGPQCTCQGKCSNREPVYGMAPSLELFRYNDVIGMGIRSAAQLSIGEIAYEFVGELCQEPGNKDFAWNIFNGVEQKDDYSKRSYRTIISGVLGIEKNDLPIMDNCVYIDPYLKGNVSRFVSHSEYPNVAPIRVFQNDLRPEAARLFFVCIREINAGEELLADYGEVYDGFKKCLCGGPACGFSRKHLRVLGPEGAKEALLDYQHRHRNGTRRLSESLGLNLQSNDGKLFLKKAERLLKVDDARLEEENKHADGKELARNLRLEEDKENMMALPNPNSS